MSNQTVQRISAAAFTRTDSEVAALTSKLTLDRRPRRAFNPDEEHSLDNRIFNEFLSIANKLITDARDAQNTLRLFPETELLKQTIVSMTISPKDMNGSDPIYKCSSTLIPPAVSLICVAEVRRILENDYGLRKDLPKIIGDAIFDKGAHVRVVIPESSLDELINSGVVVSKESMSNVFKSTNDDSPVYKSMDFLGTGLKETTATSNSRRPSMEAYGRRSFTPNVDQALSVPNGLNDDKSIKFLNLGIEVLDNYEILKLPRVIENNRSLRVKQKLTTESKGLYASNNGSITAAKLKSLMFSHKATSTAKPMVALKTGEETQRISIGKPLDIVVPTEAVIPIFEPGDPRKHVGYFFLIDRDGYFLSVNSPGTLIGAAGVGVGGGANDTNVMSLLQNRATNDLIGFRQNHSITWAANMFADVVENDLLARIKNGVLGKEYSIGKNPLAYQIMLARKLCNQHTNLLFVPAEMVTYFAYKYDQDGTGISMHAEAGNIANLRAMVKYARVQNLIRNAIGETLVTVQLSEDDADPRQTAEDIVTEMTNAQQVNFPRLGSNPNDYYNWVRKAGWRFAFTGNPLFPDVKIDITNEKSDRAIPDSDLEEELKKQYIQYFGIPPEIIENSGADFATVFEASSLLLSKRISMLQGEFNPKLTFYARSVMKADAEVVKLVKQSLEDNYEEIQRTLTSESVEESFRFSENELVKDKQQIIELLTMDFINTFELELPSPSTASLVNQKAAFDAYSDFLDEAIEKAIFNADIVNSDTSGEAANVSAMLPAIKARYLRKFMASNNIMPELADMYSLGRDGQPLTNFIEEVATHTNNLTRACARFKIKTAPVADAANKDMEQLAAPPEATSDGSGSSSDDSGTDDTSGDENADSGDTGDLSLDDGSTDLGTDDTEDSNASTEEPPADDTEEEDKT